MQDLAVKRNERISTVDPLAPAFSVFGKWGYRQSIGALSPNSFCDGVRIHPHGHIVLRGKS
jgi:hypothetical protein